MACAKIRWVLLTEVDEEKDMKSQAQGYIAEIIGACMRECVGWVEGDKHSWAVAQAEDSACENVRSCEWWNPLDLCHSSGHLPNQGRKSNK